MQHIKATVTPAGSNLVTVGLLKQSLLTKALPKSNLCLRKLYQKAMNKLIDALLVVWATLAIILMSCLFADLIAMVFQEDDPGSWQRAIKQVLWAIRDFVKQ